jgi:AcrR family transcriptional regulator
MNNKTIKLADQKKSVLTRKQIIETASKIFSAEGYYAKNSNEIARLAGVSVGTFYNNFKNKKELLLELITSFQGKFYKVALAPQEEHLLKDTNLYDIIYSGVKNSFKAFDVDPDF